MQKREIILVFCQLEGRKKEYAMPSEESYQKIEGNWGEFRFRRILRSDYKAVFDHLANNYFKDERTSNTLGWSEKYAENVCRVVEAILDLGDGMSFLAEHIPTGKIAGVRITLHHKPDTNVDGVPIDCQTAKLYLKFINDVVGLAEVEKKHGISHWAEFYIASTSRDFRNQGLAGEFYDRSIAFIVYEGFKHALVVVSSPYTRQATKKRGFQQVARLDHANFVDFDGQPVFQNEDLTLEHFALVMLKEL